jgi:ectoine hydroxylase-related dioxygenase (phytanoyl-CoA dioxygenase family)
VTGDVPVPTRDLAEARRDLDTAGYCVLADALPHDVCAAIRDRVLEQAAGERALGIGQEDVDPARYVGGSGRGEGCNRRVWTLLNKGSVFQSLLTRRDVNSLIGHVLGLPYLLSSIQANLVSPGDHRLPLHSDQGYVQRPWPPYPMTASVIWMIDTFTADNGPTTVIPGSHLGPADQAAGAAVARARMIRRGGLPVCGPAGSALVFDGRIVHGTGLNVTDEGRWGILTYFCRPFVRQQENFTLSTDASVLATLPDDLKALLGFQVWNTLGSVEGVCAEGAFVDRPATVLGPLDPAGREHNPDLVRP